VIFVLPTAVMVAWLVKVHDRPAAFVAKPLASAGFVLIALSEGAVGSAYGRIILAGLVLGALGDVALMFDRWFLAGLVLFAAGHVAYIFAFLTNGPITMSTAAVGGALGLGSAIWLLPRVESAMRVPVAVYIVVISVMVAVGIGPDQPAFVRIGAPLFAVSDLLVARERFIVSDARNRLWGLPMYYAAQVLIAITVAT
jgi:uncharacterized membrane protein YhhN